MAALNADGPMRNKDYNGDEIKFNGSENLTNGLQKMKGERIVKHLKKQRSRKRYKRFQCYKYS